MGKKKLIVIGGGAAGFFCAVNAARMNSELEVLILEKSNKLLSKVSVSGGGRCNVTHACFDMQEMSKKYPRGGNFVKKTFHQFFTTDTISWFEERGVKLKTEKDGQEVQRACQMTRRSGYAYSPPYGVLAPNHCFMGESCDHLFQSSTVKVLAT